MLAYLASSKRSGISGANRVSPAASGDPASLEAILHRADFGMMSTVLLVLYGLLCLRPIILSVRISQLRFAKGRSGAAVLYAAISVNKYVI